MSESLPQLERSRYERVRAMVDQAYEAAHAVRYDPDGAEMLRLRGGEGRARGAADPHLTASKDEDSDG